MCFCFSSINLEGEREAERRRWRAETDSAAMFDPKDLIISHGRKHYDCDGYCGCVSFRRHKPQ